MSEKGWIGVDLDGTLAHYEGWKGIEHIGAPIAPMVDRVKRWIEEGKDVRIFTARVATSDEAELKAVLYRIELWCHEYIGRSLQVTNVKDFGMVELWDDRAVQVTTNTGVTVHESAAAVARVHSEAYESMFADVGLLLEALGKPNVARPISAHEVMLECIEAVKNLRNAGRLNPATARVVRDARDDVWIDRANRYFVGVREPRKMLEAWAPGTEVADVVMHEVWKRDPNVELAAEQERTRIVNLLCDRCRAGEPVVERRLPNMGLGHTLPGIPHPGWARCYAEEIHADLRSRSTRKEAGATATTPEPFRCKAREQGTAGGNDPADCDWPKCGCDPYAERVIDALEEAGALRTTESESPSLTRLKAAAADLVKPKGERTFFTLHAPAAGGGVRVLQGRILPAGSDEGYFKTGHRKALMVLPSQASDYLLTREWVNQLFDEAESAAAKDAGR